MIEDLLAGLAIVVMIFLVGLYGLWKIAEMGG